MLKLKTILLITFLYKISSQSYLSFYIERQSKIDGYDFLHLFIHSPESDNKNKIIFRLPKKLQNHEVFKFKICQKDTIKKLKTGNIDDKIQNNCLEDSLHTKIVIDYEDKIILDEIPIYNLYKICVFGFAFTEGVKSYLHAGLTSILMKNTISDSENKLYYNDATSATELFDEAKSMNYLFLFNSDESFRCKIEIDDAFGELEDEKFSDNVFFLDRKNQSSFFVVEYDFGNNFKPTSTKAQYFKTAEMNPDMRIKRRQQVMDRLKKNMNIERDNYYKAEFEFLVFKNEKDKFPAVKLLRNKSMETLQSLNVEIGVNKYIRFFPMLCNKILEHNKTHSFEFLSEHACTPLSQEKILIGKGQKGNPYFFTQTNSGNVRITKKIKLYAQEMDLYIYPKSDPEDITIIKGFLPKCDTIFDKNSDLLYYVCYQKMTIYEDNKLIKDDEKDLKVNHFVLSDNNSALDKNLKKKKKVKGVAFGIFIVASIVFMVLSILAMIFLTGGIACIFGILASIVMGIGFAITKKRNRGHQSRVNPKKSYADVDLMEKRLWVTPILFFEKEKESGTSIFKLIVDSSLYSEKMEVDNLKKRLPKKQKDFLRAELPDDVMEENINEHLENSSDLTLSKSDIDESELTQQKSINLNHSLEDSKQKLLLKKDSNLSNSKNSLLSKSILTEQEDNSLIKKQPSLLNKSLSSIKKGDQSNLLLDSSLKNSSLIKSQNGKKNPVLNQSISSNKKLDQSNSLLDPSLNKSSLNKSQKNPILDKSISIKNSSLNKSQKNPNINNSSLLDSSLDISSLRESEMNPKFHKKEKDILSKSFQEKQKNNLLLDQVAKNFKSTINNKKNSQSKLEDSWDYSKISDLSEIQSNQNLNSSKKIKVLI